MFNVILGNIQLNFVIRTINGYFKIKTFLSDQFAILILIDNLPVTHTANRQ